LSSGERTAADRLCEALAQRIPGPGFAFALAGIAEARLDSTPV
jgi:hypothetical protein